MKDGDILLKKLEYARKLANLYYIMSCPEHEITGGNFLNEPDSDFWNNGTKRHSTGAIYLN